VRAVGHQRGEGGQGEEKFRERRVGGRLGRPEARFLGRPALQRGGRGENQTVFPADLPEAGIAFEVYFGSGTTPLSVTIVTYHGRQVRR
jgi:hypothetical protein